MFTHGVYGAECARDDPRAAWRALFPHDPEGAGDDAGR